MTRQLIVSSVAAAALAAGCGLGKHVETAPPPEARATAPPVAAVLPGPRPAAWRQPRVTVTSHADWTFDKLYLSPAGTEQWGPDQLLCHAVPKGGAFALVGLDCVAWDMKLVDEHGDACVVKNVDLCPLGGTYVVENRDLAGCKVIGTDDPRGR
ncbi:MAG: hypothetical protein IT373_22055 [Polyangiaceae bacterium]|nr:hypothetical protein [Polyangiaceae bacterium]